VFPEHALKRISLTENKREAITTYECIMKMKVIDVIPIDEAGIKSK
jgi:hypothetical protein